MRTSPENPMTWHASWIWLPPQPNMDNLYVYARREVELRTIPSEVKIRISASQLYRLYVNGTYVGRGPNPADPSYYYFDTYEIAKLLRPGRNVLAAVAYCYSVEAKGIVRQNWGRGGLLLEAEAAGVILAQTDAEWKVLQAPTWDQNSSVSSLFFYDHKEVYDTRKEIAGWMEPGFDDRGWATPEVIGAPPVAPWTKLLPREIPFLGGEIRKPVDASWESGSVTYPWRQDWEVYHESRLIEGGVHPPGKWTEVTKTHADLVPSILLDFGTLVTGFPRITVHDSIGGTIELFYGEGSFLTRVDTFVLKGGRQVLETYNRRTFRYLKLAFPDTPRRIDLDKVELQMDTYPVHLASAFSSSDEVLNRIWEVSVHTIRLSMLDHFVDCPWRERTIYGGDVYVENPIAYYAFGDPRINRKTLRQMFALQFPEGPLPPFGPYNGIQGFYPSWSAYFGLALIDDYLLTGERSFITELWPNLARLCDWTVRSSSRNSLPLLGHPGKGAMFPAWDELPKVGYAGWEVFPFQVLLARGAELAGRLGHGEEAKRWGEMAAKMATAIREHIVDPGSGLAGPLPRKPDHVFAQSDTTMLLWSGTAAPGRAAETIRRMLTPQAAAPIDTPFFGFHLLDALFREGAGREALDFTRRYWGEMLARGATTFWEHFTLDSSKHSQFGRGGSACHGWSAAPAYALPAHVLGVQPLEPGFARILVQPQTGDLAWARGSAPTPHGPVQVEWQRSESRFHLMVNLPRPGRLVLPLPNQHRPRVLLNGHLQPTATAPGGPVLEVAAGKHQVDIIPR
jgi:alpha-L-rhamnosidase